VRLASPITWSSPLPPRSYPGQRFPAHTRWPFAFLATGDTKSADPTTLCPGPFQAAAQRSESQGEPCPQSVRRSALGLNSQTCQDRPPMES
jgi:hypothetical protein